MKILILGASGFVGRSIRAGLERAGHICIAGVRKVKHADDIAVNYLTDTDPAIWEERVRGMDVVINAVGVLRDTKATPMEQIHAQTPAAIFKACANCGVERVVNISALGVDSGLATRYFESKLAGQTALLALSPPLKVLNLRPSVIYGKEGDSAKMFRLLASLPLHMLPMGGVQMMQPVHILDVVAAIARWLEDAGASTQDIVVAGNNAVSFRSMLDSYRGQQGYGGALHIPVPGFCIRLAAKIGNVLPFSPLCDETLMMLEAGNTGDNTAFAKLLGRAPLGVDEFYAADKDG